VGKRRTWRKIHLAVDETAKDIIGIEVTAADWHDSEVFPDLLAQVEGEVSQVSADGAYDTKGTHAAIRERNAKATIPPREDAVTWGNNHSRDALLAEIQSKSRAGWKEDSAYHRRSIAGNMMYRLKQLGDHLFSREFDRQVAESHVRVAIINRFTCLGMPKSVRAGQIVPGV
ncbi:MAG: IS5 family transposase, partial [Candidatus Dechloromonas phosphoritropha]